MENECKRLDGLVYAAHFLEQFKLVGTQKGGTISYANSTTIPPGEAFDADWNNECYAGSKTTSEVKRHFSVPFLERDLYTVQRSKEGFSISVPTGKSDYMDDNPELVDSGISARRYRS